jgi:hypothetical protein
MKMTQVLKTVIGRTIGKTPVATWLAFVADRIPDMLGKFWPPMRWPRMAGSMSRALLPAYLKATLETIADGKKYFSCPKISEPTRRTSLTPHIQLEARMTTLEMLIAHFGGTPVIPLEAAATYLGYEPETLAKKADDGDVRVPYFRLDDSQKAIRLMMLNDIANHIEERHRAATKQFLIHWKNRAKEGVKE